MRGKTDCLKATWDRPEKQELGQVPGATVRKGRALGLVWTRTIWARQEPWFTAHLIPAPNKGEVPKALQAAAQLLKYPQLIQSPSAVSAKPQFSLVMWFLEFLLPYQNVTSFSFHNPSFTNVMR